MPLPVRVIYECFVTFRAAGERRTADTKRKEEEMNMQMEIEDEAGSSSKKLKTTVESSTEVAMRNISLDDSEDTMAIETEEEDDDSDDDWEDDGQEADDDREKCKKQNRLSLPRAARECDRFFLTNRAAAAIITAVLRDIGFVTRDNPTNIVDRHKISRERRKHGLNQLVANRGKLGALRGLYFDGKKCRTLVRKTRKVKVRILYFENI